MPQDHKYLPHTKEDSSNNTFNEISAVRFNIFSYSHHEFTFSLEILDILYIFQIYSYRNVVAPGYDLLNTLNHFEIFLDILFYYISLLFLGNILELEVGDSQK